MKIFSADQIKAWDQYTILNEPVSSADLMERAASGCAEWIKAQFPSTKKTMIFCGPGNNGGDGLAIARLLIQAEYDVRVFILNGSGKKSSDFLLNLEKLQAISNRIELLENEFAFPQIAADHLILDALFGYGLNRPPNGLAAALVEHINRAQVQVISIDIPSGLFADKSSKNNIIIRASYTLTFQVMKLAFLLPENDEYNGNVHIVDIGLHTHFNTATPVKMELVEEATVRSYLPPRKKFSHKGTYGNAALLAGSYGMMGAVVLSARACMRSGAGKLTCYIPSCGYTIMQTAVPEAMCITGPDEKHLLLSEPGANDDAFAFGPGLGRYDEGSKVLEVLLDKKPKRLIIDADGLNILSENPALFSKIPPNSILTPHPKEFEKLFGPSSNDFERIQLAIEKARELRSFIVLKGRYSFIATPTGKGYFNPTGNPGMATAGSGDVLTGVLLGLYAQYDDPEQVVIAGVYLHGLAGDLAAGQVTETSLVAGDIIENLPKAFAQVKTREYFT